MAFLIAAAGTGGHVFPGLAVGEALVEEGVDRGDIGYVGGDRLEAEVYPAEGFRFFRVELAGLRRSLTLANARIPGVVMRARQRIADEIGRTETRVVLGMGGYVTVPTAMAARKRRVPFFNAEQNAEAGLANKLTARWARETFVSFPETKGLPAATWAGNPVRRPFWSFDRTSLVPEARQRFGLEAGVPVIGVFGGSLGARAINDAVAAMARQWEGSPIQIVHLTGVDHLDAMTRIEARETVTWRRVGFEDRMELFYAVSDLVIARAGGAVAELTATATPGVLVPGRFGSGRHQIENARFLERRGAAVIVEETGLDRLIEVVRGLIEDSAPLAAMTTATHAISKPQAALTIARTMIEAAR